MATIKEGSENTVGKNIYLTVVDDEAVEYKFHKGIDSPATADDMLLIIRRREYPDAPAGMTLDQFEAWIAAGCIIPATETEEERAAVKVPFASTHPPQRTVLDVIANKEAVQAEVDKISDPVTKAAINTIFGAEMLQ